MLTLHANDHAMTPGPLHGSASHHSATPVCRSHRRSLVCDVDCAALDFDVHLGHRARYKVAASAAIKVYSDASTSSVARWQNSTALALSSATPLPRS
jgi:hypothetical protein